MRVRLRTRVSWIGIRRKYAVADDESRAGLRCWGESFWVVEGNSAISHTSGLLIVDAAARVVQGV